MTQHPYRPKVYLSQSKKDWASGKKDLLEQLDVED